MYSILKPLLFILPPEKAHGFTMKMYEITLAIPIFGSIVQALYSGKSTAPPVKLFGLEFKNKVGLAAGFDKDGIHIHSLAKLGFGFLEFGTVTPLPQDGNPQPRLFRLKKDEALINRMGFNNRGVDHLVERLKERKPDHVIIGGNIGKNKITPNEDAINDYLICFRKLHPYVDYFVVNVSSPNTPNLRDLQEKEPLKALLKAVSDENLTFKIQRPILLKIAPDLTEGQIDDVIEIVQELKISGVIATNTTIDRSQLVTEESEIEQIGNGGLSGAPLQDRSTEVIRYIAKNSNHSFPIIGVGGIDSLASAKRKLDAGASLIQIYTGFIYKGPGLIKELIKNT